jgi:threonyl-tRNA synthetase
MRINIDGKSTEFTESLTAKEVAEKLNLTAPDQAITVSINGVLKDLSTRLEDGDEVKFVNFDDAQGKEVFWHTSAHVLAQAVMRLYPNAKATIGPPIENGFYYDFADLTISDQDLDKIEKEMKAIISENHKTELVQFNGKEEAKQAFHTNKYKCELIDSFDGKITGYKQGEFFDLCRGPHMVALGKIKALKVLKTSGAYWRGDSANEMLTRIYAISFPDKKRLTDYITMVE